MDLHMGPVFLFLLQIWTLVVSGAVDDTWDGLNSEYNNITTFVYRTTKLAMFSQRSNELNYVWFNVILFPYCSWVYVFQNFNQIIFVTNLVIKYFFHDFKAVFKLKNFKAFFAIKRSLVWLYSISFIKVRGKKDYNNLLNYL